MEPGTKKGILIGCAVATGLLVFCCILMMILGPMLAKKAVMEGVPFLIKSAVMEDLPEGVDKERVAQLIDTAWQQVLNQGFSDQIDQQEMNRLMNQDLQEALADEEIDADEFAFLVDRFNEVFFSSTKNPELLDQVKESYQKGKEDGEFTAEEINDLLGRMEQALGS